MQKSLNLRGLRSSRTPMVAAAVALSSLFLAGSPARAGGVSWTNYSVVTIGANGNPSAGGLSTFVRHHRQCVRLRERDREQLHDRPGPAGGLQPAPVLAGGRGRPQFSELHERE